MTEVKKKNDSKVDHRVVQDYNVELFQFQFAVISHLSVLSELL